MNNEARKSLLEALRVHLDSGMSEYCGYELSSSETLVIIDLLRFTIPINPINGRCICGADVRNWISDDPFNYCPKCGQRIDWSENND